MKNANADGHAYKTKYQSALLRFAEVCAANNDVALYARVHFNQ